MERELIVLFDRVQLRYYGIILVVAMLVAANVAARLARRSGRDPEHIWGALTWAIIPAIIGARLWFVFFPPAALVDQGVTTTWMLQNFFDTQSGAIAIWSGGLGIFGAVGGGLLGVWIYLRRNNLMPGPWLDIAAVALPLGQAIGRWANFVNQELYGTPTDLPWGISIDAASRIEPYRSLVEYPLETGFPSHLPLRITLEPAGLFHSAQPVPALATAAARRPLPCLPRVLRGRAFSCWNSSASRSC